MSEKKKNRAAGTAAAQGVCSKAEFAKIVNDPKLSELQKLERALGMDLCLLPNGEPSYKTLKIIDGVAAELKGRIA
jgi:hypothetical protein